MGDMLPSLRAHSASEGLPVVLVDISGRALGAAMPQFPNVDDAATVLRKHDPQLMFMLNGVPRTFVSNVAALHVRVEAKTRT
jgi:hypothetical protein